TSEQRRNLGAGLREAENVIDEEKHVVTEVAEVFGDRQARQSYAKTCSRRFRHLPENKRHLRFFQRVFIDERQVKSAVLFFVLHELFAVIDNARFDEFFEKVETLAGTFAYAGENGIAAVSFCDVV